MWLILTEIYYKQFTWLRKLDPGHFVPIVMVIE